MPDKKPDVFDNQVSLDKAIESAKKTWSYNYQTILTTLKVAGKADKDATKIPEELIAPLKIAILEHAKEIISAGEAKKANGEPF